MEITSPETTRVKQILQALGYLISDDETVSLVNQIYHSNCHNIHVVHEKLTFLDITVSLRTYLSNSVRRFLCVVMSSKYQGAVLGPEEFAEGIALGVKSLFGHAVGEL